MDVAANCSHRTQSAGVELPPERKDAFARRVMENGVDRCPDVGAMVAYDVPWDGMLVMGRFVRWAKG